MLSANLASELSFSEVLTALLFRTEKRQNSDFRDIPGIYLFRRFTNRIKIIYSWSKLPMPINRTVFSFDKHDLMKWMTTDYV